MSNVIRENIGTRFKSEDLLEKQVGSISGTVFQSSFFRGEEAGTCEILVKAIDHTHIDPDKDRRGAYKRGDPVVVMEDGHEWGLKERPPKFFVVKIPGLAVEAAKKYIESEMDLSDPENPVVYRRRLFGLPVDTLPGNIRNIINSVGTVSITPIQMKQYILNKKTGLPEP